MKTYIFLLLCLRTRVLCVLILCKHALLDRFTDLSNTSFQIRCFFIFNKKKGTYLRHKMFTAVCWIRFFIMLNFAVLINITWERNKNVECVRTVFPVFQKIRPTLFAALCRILVMSSLFVSVCASTRNLQTDVSYQQYTLVLPTNIAHNVSKQIYHT